MLKRRMAQHHLRADASAAGELQAKRGARQMCRTSLFFCPSATLPLCVKIFHRRVEIHFLILSILLILSKK